MRFQRMCNVVLFDGLFVDLRDNCRAEVLPKVPRQLVVFFVLNFGLGEPKFDQRRHVGNRERYKVVFRLALFHLKYRLEPSAMHISDHFCDVFLVLCGQVSEAVRHDCYPSLSFAFGT